MCDAPEVIEFVLEQEYIVYISIDFKYEQMKHNDVYSDVNTIMDYIWNEWSR